MSHSLPNLEEIAAGVVKMARAAGADASEASVSEGDEFGVDVRLGEIETLKESGSRAVGVRVLCGGRPGSSYTSDFTPDGLRSMVARAMDLARITSEDPHAGLPDPADLGSYDEPLDLYWDDVAALTAAEKIDRAKRCERAALDYDPRITNSDGASFSTRLGRQAFANSLGFSGSYRTSSCSMHATPVAKSGDRMERDYWYTLSRRAANLMDPEEVGRRAAARTLRRLNPRKASTQRVPVVFEQRVARSLAGHVFELVNGEVVYRKSSYLAGKLGERIGSERLTLIDDGTMPGLYGSSPFDDEGVPSRRTVVVDKGVLTSYLLNSYTARKLGMRTTGSASRGVSGNASVGHGNLFIAAGEQPAEDLIRAAGNGLFVTDLMGFGFNAATGDYSRGANGLWIENGELTHAVSEVTIAANFKDMLEGLEMAASDLEFQGSVAAPTLLVREMTISGS